MRWEGESDWKGEGPSIQMPSQPREKHSCFSPASKLRKNENTKDLLNRQTCHGILCISTQSPHNRALHMTHQRVRGSRAGRPKSSDVGIVRREQYGLVHCDNRKRPIANMAGGLWAVFVGDGRYVVSCGLCSSVFASFIVIVIVIVYRNIRVSVR